MSPTNFMNRDRIHQIGVLISKLIAIGIAMGVRRLLWVVNVFYAIIILWNSMTLLAPVLKSIR